MLWVGGEWGSVGPAEGPYRSRETCPAGEQKGGETGVSRLLPNWVRLAPHGTNMGLFKISFSTLWRGAPKRTETDL